MEFAIAMVLRPLVLLVFLVVIVRPLGRLLMRGVKDPRKRALLLRRLN